MKFAFQSVFMASIAVPCVASDSGATPTSKVIDLLNKMVLDGKKAKEDEEVEFSKFSSFCKNTIANKDQEVDDGNDKIESLSATVEKLSSEIKDHGKKIKELQELEQSSDVALEKSKKQMEEDLETSTALVQDYTESVDALGRAIKVLKSKSADKSQAAVLMELSSKRSMLPDSARSALAAFIAHKKDPDDMLFREAPEANAYEFQSGGIVEMLEKLEDEFIAKKTEAEEARRNQENNARLVQQDLTGIINKAKNEIQTHDGFLQERKEQRATASKERDVTQDDTDAASKYVADLRVECSEKEKSFREKNALRDDEIVALNKAIEILSDGKVAGAAEKHLPSLVATSLAQVRGAGGSPRVRQALASFLDSEGQRLHSNSISMLAQEVSLSKNPFTKVKKLIKDLIEKLLLEANEEADEKGWCDKELGRNEVTRNKLTSDIEKAQADLETNKAEMAKRADRLATLAQELAELQKTVKDSTDLRNEESSKNKATIKDSQEALKAVESAQEVLTEFYNRAGKATALVQDSKKFLGEAEPIKMFTPEWNTIANPNGEEVDRGHKEGMQTFGGTFKGQTEKAGGVLAMIEVIASDFARLEADTKSAEAEAQSEYDGLMRESKKSIAVKRKESDMLERDQSHADEHGRHVTNDMKDQQDMLLAEDRTYENLKPRCVDIKPKHEERQSQRAAEILSLEEALKILKAEDA